MKSMVFLLVTIILFLVAKPGMALISFQGNELQSCCVEKCNPVDETGGEDGCSENGCGGKLCNPFQVCASCVFISFQHYTALMPNLAFANKLNYYNLDCFSAYYASDFWHPPRAV